MDETIGRRLARKAGLVCTGTIGVLTKAKELKLITAVVPLLLQLREKGIWIHSKLIETVKHKLNE